MPVGLAVGVSVGLKVIGLSVGVPVGFAEGNISGLSVGSCKIKQIDIRWAFGDLLL